MVEAVNDTRVSDPALRFRAFTLNIDGLDEFKVGLILVVLLRRTVKQTVIVGLRDSTWDFSDYPQRFTVVSSRSAGCDSKRST